MGNLTFTIKINLGISQELYNLVKPFADSKLLMQQSNKPEQKPAKVEQKSAKVVPADPMPVREQAPADPTPMDPKPTEATQEYTEQDVRAAMTKTRKRIEGENYKENPDSEGYKKWHRSLTAWFKSTAAVYGAAKPSALPDSESRKLFIRDCDNVIVKNDQLTEEVPF